MEDGRCGRQEAAVTPIPFIQAHIGIRDRMYARVKDKPVSAIAAKDKYSPQGKYDDWTRNDGRTKTVNVSFNTILDNIDDPAKMGNLMKGK